MKIIKPSVEFYGPVPTDYDSAIRFIEKAGRTCYKSEDKITETSAEKFVKKLITAGHLAMVEHSNFVIRMSQPIMIIPGLFAVVEAITGKFLNVIQNDDYIYVGGNLTAWYQRGNLVGWNDSIFRVFIQEYAYLFNLSTIESIEINTPWKVCPHDQIPPTLHRYSAKFICDRGVSHELVRHRPTAMDWFGEFVDSPIDIYKAFDGSIAQESTRYVNYGWKDMEFIEPTGFENWNSCQQIQIKLACAESEFRYQQSIREGLSPQQARAVLPNALKTEVVVTADAAEWLHIKNLRTSKAAHPDMVRIMSMMPWEEFYEKIYNLL